MNLKVFTVRDHRSTLLRRTALVGLVAASATPAWADTMAAEAGWQVEVEAQRYRVGHNRIQRPNDVQGSRFEANDFTGDRGNGWRLAATRPVGWWGRDGELRLVIAPLHRQGSAAPQAPLLYEGQRFEPGRPLEVLYKFNTYRIGYSEPVGAGQTGAWALRLGATLAIRDARIRLRQDGIERNFTNWGPVPLLYASVSRPLNESWRLLADFDAFPAPGGGGLFDGSLKLGWDVTPMWAVTGGVRYQAGGAVDPEIYNSLRQTAVVVGLMARF